MSQVSCAFLCSNNEKQVPSGSYSEMHISSSSDKLHSLITCFSSPGWLSWVLTMNHTVVILKNENCQHSGLCLELVDTEENLCYDSKQMKKEG